MLVGFGDRTTDRKDVVPAFVAFISGESTRKKELYSRSLQILLTAMKKSNRLSLGN
jgi:hypothetical protein